MEQLINVEKTNKIIEILIFLKEISVVKRDIIYERNPQKPHTSIRFGKFKVSTRNFPRKKE